MRSFPVLVLSIAVRFLSPFPVSLPQLFHRCLPFAFAFGLSPSVPLSFVHFSSGSGYSAFRSFLSLLPAFPCRRFPRCFFPLPSGLFPCRPSDSGTQLSAVPFSVRCLASQWLPQRLGLLPCGSRPLPLGFRFRFWLLSLRNVSLTDTSQPLRIYLFLSDLVYTTI